MTDTRDTQLLNGLLKGENKSFETLYKRCFPSIAHYVKTNTGTMEDAQDIFQDSVFILLSKTRESNFELASSLKTYLYAIAKNLWLKRLRDDKFIAMNDLTLMDIGPDLDYFEADENEAVPDEKVQGWLKSITANCQRILKALFFYKEPMQDLMRKMGWKNKHTASNQKYKCIEQMRKEALKKVL